MIQSWYHHHYLLSCHDFLVFKPHPSLPLFAVSSTSFSIFLSYWIRHLSPSFLLRINLLFSSFFSSTHRWLRHCCLAPLYHGRSSFRWWETTPTAPTPLSQVSLPTWAPPYIPASTVVCSVKDWTIFVTSSTLVSAHVLRNNFIPRLITQNLVLAHYAEHGLGVIGQWCVLCRATGGAGEKLLMPGTGFLTVGAASTLAFCQVLREEYPEVPCKLNQVWPRSIT